MQAAMKTADRITAVIFGALGLAMLVGGYRMDRLEIRQIHPASIPGLVPMILGALLVICAVLLAMQTRRAGDPDEGFMQGGSLRNLGATAALCLIYALVLVGWLPFFWSTALFISAFALVFHWPTDATTAERLKAAALCVGLGVIAAAGISALFEHGFLVRLP